MASTAVERPLLRRGVTPCGAPRVMPRATHEVVDLVPTINALILEDLLTAVHDRSEVAGEVERTRLRLGRLWLEGHLASELRQ